MQELHIALPRLIGSRESADDLLEPLLHDLEGAVVIVDCAELLTASPSFADQLVGSGLDSGRAASMVLLNPPPSFRSDVERSAHKRGVYRRIEIRDTAYVA